MKIVADVELAEVRRQFAGCGELILAPGREIDRQLVASADALLVRSVTRVDDSLLAGSRVRFVGSATSGTDHVDLACLRERGIRFADARGCNASAVVDYCFAGLAWCVLNRGLDLASARVGIVGCGRIGSLFAERLRRLDVSPVLCDPPLAQRAPTPGIYHDLEVISGCQVVSLHVPLSRSGQHATGHLIDGKFLDALPGGAVLVNTCRGGVVNEAALTDSLRRRDDLVTIVDVWEGEPSINRELALGVDLATPHIAGHSRTAKVAATSSLRRALQAAFELGNATPPASPATPGPRTLEVEAGAAPAWQTLLRALPLDALSDEFKNRLKRDATAPAFERSRRRLRARREFGDFRVAATSCSASERKLLTATGFKLL